MASEENNKADLILFILDKLIKVSQFIIQAVPHLVRRKIGISIILHSGSTFSLSGSRCLLLCRPCSRHQWGMGFPQTHVNFLSLLRLCQNAVMQAWPPIYLREHTVCTLLKGPLPLCWHHDIMYSEWNMMSPVNQSELSLMFPVFLLMHFSTKGILSILQTHKQTASLVASVLDSVQSRWVGSFYM